MNDYDRMKEVAELAKTTVWRVLLEGQEDRKRGWEKEAPSYHAERAYNHLLEATQFPAGRREELEHALTRNSMTLYLLDPPSDSDRGGKE